MSLSVIFIIRFYKAITSGFSQLRYSALGINVKCRNLSSVEDKRFISVVDLQFKIIIIVDDLVTSTFGIIKIMEIPGLYNPGVFA